MNPKSIPAIPLLALLCLATLLVQWAAHPHGHFPYEEWIGFVALAGVAGIFLLIAVARGLRNILRRDVSYYEDELETAKSDP